VEATKGENDRCPTMFQWTEERTLTRIRTRNYYVHLKGKTGVSFPCEVIKYKAQKLSKSHVMWHQFHATMGLHTYDVDE
jgi:hypothetical protein